MRPQNSDRADIILHGGKVLTVSRDENIEQAVAIKGESLQAVGRDQDVLALAGSNTKMPIRVGLGRVS